ncbi:MAG: futalosine hydrolase [Desulfomonile tiedjei]|nr:futalosine hydrolase [Desulfomonile tiedjei]
MVTCIVAALDSELDQAKKELNARLSRTASGFIYYIGVLRQNPIYLAPVGAGIVSAAVTLGHLLTHMKPDQVIMAGSAGALPGSGLEIGDVAVASSEILAELGICSGEGVGEADSLNLLGFRQTIELDEHLGCSIVEKAEKTFKVYRGVFLSVAGVSNQPSHALTRAGRFGALVENMEGYALALAGMRFGIKVAEVRGVSNIAGIRDKSAWNLDLANERAQSLVLNYLRREY